MISKSAENPQVPSPNFRRGNPMQTPSPGRNSSCGRGRRWRRSDAGSGPGSAAREPAWTHWQACQAGSRLQVSPQSRSRCPETWHCRHAAPAWRRRQCQFFSDGLLCAAAVAPANLYLNRASDARVTVTTVTPSRGQALPLARDRSQNQSSASRASVTDRPAVQLVT